jgi:hypothetical protein
VGTLAGEPLRANANLLGTASEAEIVLQDTSPAQVATTISEEWERLGWTSETITGTGTITVSGTLNDVTYAARVDPCSDIACYPQDGDVRVRVWRQR